MNHPSQGRSQWIDLRLADEYAGGLWAVIGTLDASKAVPNVMFAAQFPHVVEPCTPSSCDAEKSTVVHLELETSV